MPIQLLGARLECILTERATRMPERQAFSPQRFQLHSEPASRSSLVLYPLAHIAEQVRPALLLRHAGQFLGVIAFAATVTSTPW